MESKVEDRNNYKDLDKLERPVHGHEFTAANGKGGPADLETDDNDASFKPEYYDNQ